MNYICLAIFIIASSIHLLGSFKCNRTIRNITKPFLLSSLLGFYYFSVSNPLGFVILAISFSLLGDILLIPHGVKWFTVGGICFIVSHVFYILSYVNYINFSQIPVFLVILVSLLFVSLTIYIFFKLKTHLLKGLLYPTALYLLINGTMNCFALFRLITNVDVSSIITVVGAFCFFMSDATLFFVRFKKDSKLRSHFPVMLPYCVAELLIVLGFVL